MRRVYKLAANFNAVEFVIEEEDLWEVAQDGEIIFLEEGSPVLNPNIPEEVFISRILQREYDIIAGIETVAPVKPVAAKEKTPTARQRKMGDLAIHAPSDSQVAFAKSLGMKNPEQHTRKEVWEYIQEHR